MNKTIKATGCPYRRGTDTLKMHYLFMPIEQARKMDAVIGKRSGTICGKPIHLGSCMCREHLPFSRGYKQRPLPYPAQGAAFTCAHSPDRYDSNERWIIYDKKEHFCLECVTEAEAKETVDRWIAGGADRITLAWKAPKEDADDSDRGTYYVGMKGSKHRVVVRGGWFSMEDAARKSAALREATLGFTSEKAVAIFEALAP